jgi:ABC-type transport system substrate-binding protein
MLKHINFKNIFKPVLVLAIFLSFFLGKAYAEPSYGGHLRVGIPKFPTSLDAHLGRSGWDAYYWRQITDHLVDADRGLKPRAESSLAESWEFSENPDALTLTLRKGVTFHDGTNFDADAVKFNIDRILDAKTAATPRAAFTIITSVDVLSSHKVRFNLSRPWGSGLAMLADRWGTMNSPAAILKLGEDYGWNAVSTGPFKIKEVVSGSHIHFVQNENYWGKYKDGNRLPYLDEVTVRVVKDPSVLTASLRSGEIDLAYAPHKDAKAFKEDSNFNHFSMEAGKMQLIVIFNLAKAPVDNIYLRKAITHSIDPNFINKALYFGENTVADSGMWPTGAWAHDPNVARPHYDPKKVKEFLKQGGKPNGFEFSVVSFGSMKPALEIIQAQLAQNGIKMNIDILSGSAINAAMYKEGKYAMAATSWSRYPEPDWIGSLMYKSDGYYNAGKLPNPELDALLEKGASLTDVEERKKVYKEVNSYVLDQSWVVPIIYQTFTAVAPKKVKGLETLTMHDGKMNFRLISMD